MLYERIWHTDPNKMLFLDSSLPSSTVASFLYKVIFLALTPSLLDLLILYVVSFPDSLVGKESDCNSGDPGSIHELGRSPGEGIGYPLQYSWASLVAQLVKNTPAMQEILVHPWVGKIPWRRERVPTLVIWPREFHGLTV